MTSKADDKKTDAAKADAPKADAPEKVAPLVGTDNPEGIDLSKGAKDAATAFEPEEK
jgi:hypothetical protein